MFTKLIPLVRASDKVVLTLTMQGDTMSVVVMPVIKDAADPALTRPLILSATPAELDAEFAAAVTSVTEAHRSLAEQAEATKSILDAAKSTQSSKATKALAKAASPSTSDATSDAGDDDESEGGGGAQPDAKADASTPASTGTDLASLL
ncbi:PRTRC system protein E [Cupriavidus pauculus]|uniref:PRTRC system protein E n=1 Tax=Cupriavidus pauculus TaxID=82633 RepID=UPI00078474E3|nr:PRTRC system protein E [Cupriavidus pauculus]